MTLARRAVAEGVGTALLLAAVVGSGIAAERLAGGNVAVALLANTLATGGALIALILAFGSISGAHLNPAVTLADAWRGGISWRDVPAYVAAQTCGAIAGVAIANTMFGLPPIFFSHHARTGGAQWLGEFVATFGLLATIWGCSRVRADATPYAVAAYIVGAYWFTSSTSFANPAVTVARSMSDTFAGIRPNALRCSLAGLRLKIVRSSTMPPSKSTPFVLFVCKHNTGRSQMAEAFLRDLVGDRVRVASAGTIAGDRPDPGVVAAMAEIGIDISAARPKLLDPGVAAGADRIITMGCDVAGVAHIDDDWGLPDPKGESPERLREIREMVRIRARTLAISLGVEVT